MVQFYSDFKVVLESIFGVDRNVLHVHLGIVLFLVLARFLPDPHRYWKALAWLIVIELLNELLDYAMAYRKGESLNVPDLIADLINTMIWPAAWCLFRHRVTNALRRQPDPGVRREVGGADDAPPAGGV